MQLRALALERAVPVKFPRERSRVLPTGQLQFGRWRSCSRRKNSALRVRAPTDNLRTVLLILLNSQTGVPLDVELRVPMLLAPAPRLQLSPDAPREQRAARLEFRVPGVLDQYGALEPDAIMLAALPMNAYELDLHSHDPLRGLVVAIPCASSKQRFLLRAIGLRLRGGVVRVAHVLVLPRVQTEPLPGLGADQCSTMFGGRSSRACARSKPVRCNAGTQRNEGAGTGDNGRRPQFYEPALRVARHTEPAG